VDECRLGNNTKTQTNKRSKLYFLSWLCYYLHCEILPQEFGAHSAYLLTFHLVWCVKYRRKVLTDEIGDRLKQIVEKLLIDAECSPVAIETDIDHIHIVFRSKPTHQLSKVINSLKGVSARRLFQEFPQIKTRLWNGNLWSPSYFLVTVGGAPLEVIKRCVEEQQTSKSK